MLISTAFCSGVSSSEARSGAELWVSEAIQMVLSNKRPSRHCEFLRIRESPVLYLPYQDGGDMWCVSSVQKSGPGPELLVPCLTLLTFRASQPSTGATGIYSLSCQSQPSIGIELPEITLSRVYLPSPRSPPHHHRTLNRKRSLHSPATRLPFVVKCAPHETVRPPSPVPRGLWIWFRLGSRFLHDEENRSGIAKQRALRCTARRRQCCASVTSGVADTAAAVVAVRASSRFRRGRDVASVLEPAAAVAAARDDADVTAGCAGCAIRSVRHATC